MVKRPVHRACAAFLAVLWIGMPLAAVLHVGLEQHNYCAEHQTLEHGQADAAADNHAAASEHRTVSRRDTARAGHEKCFVAKDCVRDGDVSVATATAAKAPPSQDTLVVHSQTVATPISIIYSAPKTSPPSPFA